MRLRVHPLLRPAAQAYSPLEFACQISITASGTGFPSPSNTLPFDCNSFAGGAGWSQVEGIQILEADSEIGTDSLPRCCLKTHLANLISEVSFLKSHFSGLKGCFVAPTKDQVKFEGKGEFRLNHVPIELRDEAIARILIRGAVEDRIAGQ